MSDRPKTPTEKDCCGQGCLTCVFDLHRLELKRWNEKKVDVAEEESCINIYEYRSFEISEIVENNNSLKTFTFRLPTPSSCLALKCGQHVVARCKDDEGRYIIRPYTPITKPNKPASFKVAIKVYDNGRISQCVSKWKVGDSIEWRGPFGEFQYQPNKYGTVLMICGGTGITPMIQVIREILTNEQDDTQIHLLHSIQRTSDLIAPRKLKKWQAHWNFTVQYFVTQEKSARLGYNDVIHEGRITTPLVTQLLSDSRPPLLVLACGSKDFNEHISTIVLQFSSQIEIFCF